MSKKQFNLLKQRFLVLAFLAFILAGSLGVAQLFAAYAASNILGQTADGSPDYGPVYTTSDINDGDVATGQLALSAGGDMVSFGSYTYISDTANNRVLVFNNADAGSAYYKPEFVIGQPDFNTVTAGLAHDKLDGPTGLAIDTVNGRLFVSDTNNNRILVFDVNSPGTNLPASKVIGQAGFFARTAGVSIDSLDTPRGIDYYEVSGPSAQFLYVADTGNNRVLQFDILPGIPDGEAMDANTVLGQIDFDSNLPNTGGATPSSKSMSLPYDVVFSENSGTPLLYVADTLNNRVLIFNAAGGAIGISTYEVAYAVWGQPLDSLIDPIDDPFDPFDSADGCDLSYGASQFCNPTGVSAKSGGSLVAVSDLSDNRVMIFSSSDVGADYPPAANVLGYEDFTEQNPADHFFSLPFFAAYDVNASGNLFVGDTGHYRVLVFEPPLNDGEDAVGVFGHFDVDGDPDFSNVSDPIPFATGVNDRGINTSSGYPSSVALDESGHRLFVADPGNNRVLVFNLNSSNVLVDRHADKVLGQTDFITNSPGTTATTLSLPTGLAYFPSYAPGVNYLFVSDSANNRVMVFDVTSITDGEPAVHVLGQEDLDDTGGDQSDDSTIVPDALALNTDSSSAEKLYVADTGNYRVLVFDVNTIDDGEAAEAELGQTGFDVRVFGDTSPDGSVMTDPQGIAYFSGHNQLFVSDSTNNRVLMYDVASVSNGETATAVLGQSGFGLNSNGLTDSKLTLPKGLGLNTNNGILYVSDSASNRVLGFDVNTVTDGEAAVSVLGKDDFTSNLQQLSQSGLTYPSGLTVDPTTNRLYVTDTGNNRILIYYLPYVPDGSITLGAANNVTGVTSYQGIVSFVSSSSLLPPGLVEDSGVISSPNSAYEVISGFSTLFSGTYTYLHQVIDTLSSLVFYSNKATYSGTLSASYFDNISAVANQPPGYLSTSDFGNYSGAVHSVPFDFPEAVELDKEHGRLFVADTYNNRIMVFNLNSGRLTDFTPDYYLGQTNSSNTSAGTTISTLTSPTAMVYDPDTDFLYVADTGNHRVLAYDTNSLATGMSASRVLGQSLYTTATYGTTQSTFRFPEGLAVDQNSDLLFVSDTGNNRVLVFDTSLLSNGMNASYRLGQGNYTTSTIGSYPSGLKFPTELEYDQGLNMLYVLSDEYVPGGAASTLARYDMSTITNGENALLKLEDGPATIAGIMGTAFDPETKRMFVTLQDYSNLAEAFVGISSPDTASAPYRFQFSPYLDGDSLINEEGILGTNDQSYQFITNYGSPDRTSSRLSYIARDMVYNDETHELYVLDSGNKRVMVFDFITISNTTVVDGTKGTSYSQATSTTQSQGAKTYTVASGSLPAGLSLGASTGIISGTPTTAGGSTFAIRAYDRHATDDYPNVWDEQSYSMTVNASSNPVITSVGSSVTSSSATITWTTDEAASSIVDYGLTTGYGTITSEADTSPRVTSHSVILTGLSSSTTYYFQLSSKDASNNTGTASGFSFTTSSPAPDITAPHSTNIVAVPTNTTVTITWTTDENASSFVNYGTDSGMGTLTSEIDTSPRVTSHSVTITGLEPGTAYFYEVTSKDASNNTGVGIQKTFDTTIFEGVVAIPGQTSATINWDTTGWDSTSSVSYGFTASYGTTTPAVDTSPTVISHSVPISGLVCNATYHFNVTSVGTVAGLFHDYTSDDYSFITDPCSGGGGGGGSSHQCSDHLDNDGDSFIDLTDPGCSSPIDNDETNTTGGGGGGTTQCSDNNDNDNDGKTDYPADIGCTSSTDTNELNRCVDGIDNDGDGLIDFGTSSTNDPGCASAQDNAEFNVVTPPIIPIQPPIIVTPPVITPPVVVPPSSNPPVVPPPSITPTSTGCFGILVNPTIWQIIQNQVSGSFCVVMETLQETSQYIDGVMSASGNVLAKTIAVVGLIMGAVFSIVPFLFITPFSFSEIALLPFRLWSLLMSLFGLKKHVRPWGTVYDAVTKQPLDPAVVELQDVEGNSVATSTTDIDGRYGFLVGPGKYRLLPKKTNYAFPSLKLIGKTRDELYLDLYFGYVFEIAKEGDVIIKNIPMDPEKFDWNEFEKNQRKLMKFYSRRDFIYAYVTSVVFTAGFAISSVAIISAATTFNILIFALYVILLILREVGIKHSSFGQVLEKDGTPLSFAIIRVFTKNTNVEINHKVANNIGRFYCLLTNGTYRVTIERKNHDESYTQVYDGDQIITKGVLKGKIIV